ncbi:APC family permease [Noviherbaspirillum sp.]|uniref:APC family permease n=1 Tax=Noviherbaspirillum sp. TaxID=1926288 RepID=UPI002D3D5416|nr:amino acid permease [Noviherbaspirillum sp.]HZW20038.1 amino acid permease [Noviherbaspirillum sp.]
MMQERPTPAPDATGPHSGAPQQILGVREAVAIIVGIVVGAGIFKAPAMVAAMSGSASWMFAAWLLGGVMSLIGALCYAELATAYSHTGGDYHFLRRAYGGSVAFLFGWARFSVITTGSIALLAFVFGDYMHQILPLPGIGKTASQSAYAAGAVVLLSWVNLRSTRTGASTQSWLTALEVLGLLLIVGAALVTPGQAEPVAASTSSPGAASLGMAMVFVLLTYGGWNEAAYISAELKGGSRNMVRSLVWSILIITLLYLLVTWSYWKVLGMEGVARSEAVAADMLKAAFGDTGARLISAIVAISALTSINATMIVGARTNYAIGRDWPILAPLGAWDGRRDTPANALRLQCAAALLLVAVGTWTGSGFKSMVEFTAPVFWLFFFLSGLSLFVLRAREPQTARPFKVPLYPLLPAVFCATCAYMLWSSLSYVYSQSLGGLNAAWIGVVVLAAGLVLLLLMRARPDGRRQSVIRSISGGDAHETP